jgi:hypothetical protein
VLAVTASTTSLDADTIIIYSVYLPNFKNKNQNRNLLNKAESERFPHKERDRDNF